MRKGILGLELCCGEADCPECEGITWFIVATNPFGMVKPARGVENPGTIGEYVTFDLDGNGRAINVTKLS